MGVSLLSLRNDFVYKILCFLMEAMEVQSPIMESEGKIVTQFGSDNVAKPVDGIFTRYKCRGGHTESMKARSSIAKSRVNLALTLTSSDVKHVPCSTFGFVKF